MSLPLVIKPLAEADLADARAWYEAQRAGLGDETLLSVDETLSQVARSPQTGPRVFQVLRRAAARRFPYGVFFRIDEDQITIVALDHARRDLRGWQSRA